MARRLSRPSRPGLPRRLAGILLAGLAFALALSLGLALFLPWDLVWPRVLARAAAGAPGVALGWRSLEQASALGFTLRGVSANATGRLAAEAESLTLRLGTAPLTIEGLAARTGRSLVRLERVRLELGLSPLAVLRLEAGGEFTLRLIRNRTLVAGGRIDLARLLPESRLAGAVEAHADLAWPDWARPPAAGSAELAAEALTLPDGRAAAGLAASASLEGDRLTLRELRLREPVPLRGRGHATLAWNNLPTSTYEFTGLAFPGLLDQEIRRQGRASELFQP